jgi:monoterpene epsilon-lactone hydrolase
MSIRAKLVNLFLKRTIRRQFESFKSPEDFRAGGSMPFKLPQEVMAEAVELDGVAAEWVSVPGASDEHVMLYLHGGAYIFGGPDSHRDLAWRLSKACGVRVLVVDYRLAPENPFPAAVDDATNCSRWLLNQGIEPANFVIAGDSAGGGLAAATMVNLKNLGIAQPACGVLISPWADLSVSGESAVSNADSDVMLTAAALRRCARYYLGDRDPKAPLASPIFADLSGLPPMHVMVGSGEILLSDAERFVDQINAAGGSANLTIWDGMPHVFPLFAGLIPEGRKGVEEIGTFVRQALNLKVG